MSKHTKTDNMRPFMYLKFWPSPFIGLALLLFAQLSTAQTPGFAGEIEQSRGVGFIQTPGQSPRSMGKGVRLSEGDRLTTAADSLAIMKLSDGTKMTIRPNSDMVLTEFKYKENAPDNSFVLDLLRGGLRAITGLVSKNAPNAAKIKTSTATIGIRGTDFDARLCQGGECRAQNSNAGGKAQPAAIAASAKLLRTQGNLQVVDNAGQRRVAVEGAAVYPGEIVETSANAQAVLAFRDDSKVALGASTRFKVDNFVFDPKAPSEGSFITTLLRGSLRAVTGLIGKSNARNVRYSTSTATIGIRGTEFVLVCEGPCAEGGAPGNPIEGLLVFTFEGAVTATPVLDNLLRLVEAGGGLQISPSGVAVLTALPAGLSLPTSPALLIIPASFFAQGDVPEGQDGLYVYVREGHVEVNANGLTLHLGAGETGWSQAQGSATRPSTTPQLITDDTVPLPTMRLPVLTLLPRKLDSLPQCPRV